MRFASLGSGSSGNALVVEENRTRVLLDCGFGLRETIRRLARIELAPEDLTGIVVTHEHADHAGGVVKFARKFNLPVWLTHGTLSAIRLQFPTLPQTHIIDSHTRFHVGDIELEPFPVPHDAREPTQYVFGNGARRLGVLTDAGCATPHMAATLSGCDALVLECNHDADMLREGPYPAGLKQRVAGRFGHLDNAASAGLLASIDRSGLQHVIAAHLSQQNNTAARARGALAGAMGCEDAWIGVAEQESGFDWRYIE